MFTLSLTPFSFLCNLFVIVILLTSKFKVDNNNNKKFDYIGNFITGDTYGNNLKIAFMRVTLNSKLDNDFTNTISGENKDKVNLIGICRGDINPQYCRKCLIGSKSNITQACPNKKEAIG
ncbi:hypothetical protein RYX36_000053, partial [Vicia faba]